MGHDVKIERDLNAAELGRLLAELGQGLAGSDAAPVDWLEGVDLGGVDKVKLTIKRRQGGFTLKAKAKARVSAQDLAGMDLPADGTGKPRYKDLKKRMKACFKAILHDILEDKTPDQAVLASFMEDSRTMATYPGKGDEFYPDYLEAVDALGVAAEAGDMEAMRLAALNLDRLKGECHDRYE